MSRKLGAIAVCGFIIPVAYLSIAAQLPDTPNNAGRAATQPTSADVTTQPTHTNTDYALWRKKAMSALETKFVPDWEFNLSYQDDKDGMRVTLSPRGESVLDGAIELLFSFEGKLTKLRGSVEYTAPGGDDWKSGRDIRIAQPIVIPIEKTPNPLDMRVIDVALREARPKLEQGAEYNTNFYYGPRGSENRPGIYVEFLPAEVKTAPTVSVSFDIVVEEN